MSNCLLCNDPIEQVRGICKDCYESMPVTKQLRKEIKDWQDLCEKYKRAWNAALNR